MNDVRNFFSPRLCFMCHTILHENENNFCYNCIDIISNYFCKFYEENELENTIRKDVDVACVNCLFKYNDQLINSFIINLKYKKAYSLGITLGNISGQIIKESPLYKNIDCIIPIPLTKSSYKKRGYNQSTAISEGIKEVYNIPIYEDVLIRIINNKKQSTLSMEERHVNLNNAFDVINADKIKGKNILLIDDVITTGSTIINSVKALKKIENTTIFIFALASAK